MNRRLEPQPQDTHRCEEHYEAVEDCYPVAEDEALIWVEKCTWAPILDAKTDYERDETYRVTGEECGEQRIIRWDLTEIRTPITESWTSVEDAPQRELLHVIEEVECPPHDDRRFEDIPEPYGNDEIVVSVKDGKYQARYEDA